MNSSSIIKLIYFFLFLLLGSCVFRNCKKNYLSKEEKSWFKAYNLNDTIVFQSDKLNLYTFIVKTKFDIFSKCNKLERSNFQNNTCYIELIPISNEISTYSSISVEFEKVDGDSKCNKYFRVLDLWGEYSVMENKLISDEVQLKLKKFKTLFFEKGKNAKTFGNNSLKSFNWNKEIGLVRFETSEGEVFELIKK